MANAALTRTEYKVMRVIAGERSGIAPVRKIAQAVGVTGTTVRALLKGLERGEYIKRSRATSNASYKIKITKSGRIAMLEAGGIYESE